MQQLHDIDFRFSIFDFGSHRLHVARLQRYRNPRDCDIRIHYIRTYLHACPPMYVMWPVGQPAQAQFTYLP